jgi:hypothetical protein
MTAPHAELDHVTVMAASLVRGINYVSEVLGATVPQGGKHPLMGTHNALAQLGDEKFLEILAIDPEAERPKRPRWFCLDMPDVQEALTASRRICP